ncbi:MAG TPA: DoxX family protein [Candidatus Paceibacterota bacterium]
MNILKCTCSDSMAGVAPLVLRVVVGLIFAMHGWQKLTGGVEGTAGFLGSLGFPLPMLMAVLLIAAELGGGILLILGIFTHWISKVLAFVALIALLTVHVTQGFFVNEGGFEFIILIFAATVSLAITGPGKWALGRMVNR